MEIILSHPFLNRKKLPKELVTKGKGKSKSPIKMPEWMSFFQESKAWPNIRKRDLYWRFWLPILKSMIERLFAEDLMEY